MWKQWIPFAGVVAGTGTQPALPTRIFELLIVGAISSVTTLKAMEMDVSALKDSFKALAATTITRTEFNMHTQQNTGYRERMAKEKVDEDRKWDARITRLENCFILRECKK
jgi:hypothetical protein